MEKENEEAVETEESLDLPADPTEGEEDTTDWKAEAQKLRDKAIAQRERTKSLKQQLAETKKAVEIAVGSQKSPPQPKTGELDETSLLWLEVKGIKTDDSDELNLVEEWRKDSGKDVRAIYGSKAFQAELKTLRADKEVLVATPGSTKRGGGQVGDFASAAATFEQTGILPEDRALADVVVDSITKTGNDRIPPWQR